MRTRETALVRIVVASGMLFASCAGLLGIPQQFFAFSVRAENLVLQSDREFSEAAGKQVLELAAKKLARSPLFSGRQSHSVFICNSRWRQMLFFNKDFGVGGVAQYPATPNVFLRARIEDNRLISPRGTLVMGDHSGLLVAHEITHQLTGRAVGPPVLPVAAVGA
jgi:hypothetical protein